MRQARGDKRRFAFQAVSAIGMFAFALFVYPQLSKAQTDEDISLDSSGAAESPAPPANDDPQDVELPQEDSRDREAANDVYARSRTYLSRGGPEALRSRTIMAEEREREEERKRIDPVLTAEEREALRATGSITPRAQSNDDMTPGPKPSAYEDDFLSGEDLGLRKTTITGPEEEFTPYPNGRRWQGYHPPSDDPYSAVGIRAGSFILYPEIIVEGVYDDNIFLQRNNRRDDGAFKFKPGLEIESDWNRHAVAAALRGAFDYHNEYDSEDIREYSAKFKGRLDIRKRTNFEADASYDFSQEGRGSLDFPGAAAERTDIESYVVGATVNHRFNRLAVSIRGTVSETEYGNTALIGGGTQSNADRDYAEYEGILRLSYDFKPGFAIFTEGELGSRDYDQLVDNDGYRRSSDRYKLRGGLSMDIGPKLRGEFGIGYASQDPDDPNLSGIEGVVLDGLLEWRPREYTTITFVARSDIEETSYGAASGILERYYAADIRHALRRHLILTAGINYRTEDYEGIGTTQETFGLNAGAEYFLSPRTALLGNYVYTSAGGDGDAQHYQDNEVRLGLRLRR